MRSAWMGICASLLLVAGCGREPGSKVLVRGTLNVEVDEAVFRALENEASEFQSLYPESKLALRQVQGREAIADFAADSVRVIVTARELNKDERNALVKGKIPLDEYKMALSAVAVVTHPGVPIKRITIGMLDSIFSGAVTRWPGGGVIEVLAAGRNSSANETFRVSVMGGRDFGPTVEYIDSSVARLDRVSRTSHAIGLAPVNWVKGMEGKVNVVAVGGPQFRPDTTAAAGQYYAPWQAYVYLGYYPISAPVYVYSRVMEQDISLGFISFMSSAPGQKILQNNGLVPVTMPVRLVSLTSQQVR